MGFGLVRKHLSRARWMWRRWRHRWWDATAKWRASSATLLLWRPPAPNGYPDSEAAWLDGVPHRIDIATEFAARVPHAEPLALLESGLGPLASPETRLTVARAESRPQAVALLVMAPEFLRR